MAVEVVTPEDFLGEVIGDLSRRRGKVQGQEPRGNALAIQAFVPLGEMFGYATDLRSSTQGRANYTMQFERYEEVPANIAERDCRAPDPRTRGGGVGCLYFRGSPAEKPVSPATPETERQDFKKTAT